MLKYLIVILDDASVPICDYMSRERSSLISIENLNSGLVFAMKQGLAIQVVYPAAALPEDYTDVLSTVDKVDFKIFSCAADDSEILVYPSLLDTHKRVIDNSINIIHTTLRELSDIGSLVPQLLTTTNRINLVITDIDHFSDADFNAYGHILESWIDPLVELYSKGLRPQINVLTDRIGLDCMNNCNAGFESITLAPDGMLYVCPAFYFDGFYNIGDARSGVKIPNAQLYDLGHAPICSVCDAYQCRRCIFRNLKRTFEVNIPGKNQCVAAHVERNASRILLNRLKTINADFSVIEIPIINYTDPLDKLRK